MESVFSTEGYFDSYNYGTDVLTTQAAKGPLEQRKQTAYTMVRNLYSSSHCVRTRDSLLVRNHWSKMLSLNWFDRADPATLIKLDKTVDVPKYLEIKNCVAYTEYISSPAIRSYFQDIDYNPIPYSFDDTQVLFKGVPTGEKQVRFDNLIGGNVPTYMFAAIIKTANLNDASESSTGFVCNNVETFNISLNGSSVNGYPITIQNESPIYPMANFFDTCGRFYNINFGDSLIPNKFKCHFLWSHHFEAETTAQ